MRPMGLRVKKLLQRWRFLVSLGDALLWLADDLKCSSS